MSATPPDKVPAPPGVILVADDEESIRWVLERACAKDGHTVHAVGSGREALAALRERAYDVALIDIRMPDLSGLEVLTRAREDHIDTLFIIMTAQNTMANAIEATKRGAYDYLTKPFDLDQVEVLVGRAMELRRLTRDLERLRGELEQRDELVVGKTSAMQEVYKVIGRAAPTEATVLIQGETGTGKELVAKTIHYHSERRGPFVALNCSAIPNELLESELFGYERGAFTGAVERRIGKFEAAAGGTLFLDEIAELSPALQAKLLRVLQEKEIRPVGSTKTHTVSVRMIAATNKNLEAVVQSGGFRQDLFYRLNVVRIVVPPLRERKSDIPALLTYFLRRFNERFRRDVKGIAPDAMAALTAYDFPGNVRELENLLERAFALGARDEIERTSLPDLTTKSDAPVVEVDDVLPTLDQAERDLIARALERFRNDKEQAARALGLTVRTLYRRIKKFGLV